MGFRDAFRGLLGGGSGDERPESELSGDWEIVGGDVVDDSDASGRAEGARDRSDVEAFPPGEAAAALAGQWSGYDLDFSPASLARLDDLVDAELSPSQYEIYEFRLGAYLGEVLVRHHGARWTPTEDAGWIVEVPTGADDDTVVELGDPVRAGLRGDVTFVRAYERLVADLDLDEQVSREAGSPETSERTPETSERTPETSEKTPEANEKTPEASQKSFDAGDDEDGSTAEYYRERAERIAWAWPEYDLDFSVESLVRLDRLVADEPEANEGTPGDDFAGYLAEVFRRHHDAAWRRNRGEAVLVVRGRAGVGELTAGELAAAREDPVRSFVETYAQVAADVGLRTLADED